MAEMKIPVPSKRTVHVLFWIAGGVALVAFIWVAALALSATERADSASKDAAAAQRTATEARADKEVNALAAKINARKVRILQRQVRQLGEEPVTGGPAEPVDPALPEAEIEQDQVDVAVVAYCQRNDCEASPTTGQVIAAVATLCERNGQCRGPVGDEGEPGIQGDQGPPPDDAQVAAAVASYCAARGDCVGPAGPAPTPEQIATEVAAYCAANGDCQGPRGEPGPLCPTEYVGRELSVLSPEGGIRTIYACVPA